MEITTRRRLVGAAWACVGLLGLSALTGVAVAAEQSPAAPAAAVSSGTPAAGPAATSGRPGLRALGGRVLHGQLTLRTKDGTRTVDVQMGTVTAASATSLTVRSPDWFTLTWTIGSSTLVRAGTTRSTASALAVGQTVRVLGPVATSSGGAPTARIVRIRPAAAGQGGAPGGQTGSSPSATSSSA